MYSRVFDFFNNLNSLQQKLVLAILAVLLYVASTSASYFAFSDTSLNNLTGGPIAALPSIAPDGEEDPSIPRTEPCPLNGALGTKNAKEAWEKRRPLAVMIENHVESRPQSGLSSADVVYEAVAEGGITRFMGVYLCKFNDVQLGPVRSARTYFLSSVLEYDALYAHVGGANTPGPADALGQIIQYNIKDLNQFSIGFPTFWRDYQRLGRAVATEHTMYSSTHKLWAVGEKKGWTATASATTTLGRKPGPAVRWDANFEPWKFKDDQKGQSTNKIEVTFWESQKDYMVEWNYDSSCNCYKRNNGGSEHKDLNNDKQLAPKNIVVRFMKQSNANDGYPGNVHLLYQNTGQGKALVFQDGKVTEATWNKANRNSREKFLDKSGKEITFNRGQIWLQIVPEGSKVVY